VTISKISANLLQPLPLAALEMCQVHLLPHELAFYTMKYIFLGILVKSMNCLPDITKDISQGCDC
jgi:hypothetical protein